MEWTDAQKLREKLENEYPFGTRIRLIKDNRPYRLSQFDGKTGTILRPIFNRRGPYVDGVNIIVKWDNSDLDLDIVYGRDEFRRLNDNEIKQEQELADFAKQTIGNLKSDNDSESMTLPCNIIGTMIQLTVTLSVISDDIKYNDDTGESQPMEPYNEYELELKRVNKKGKTSFRRNHIIRADDIISEPVSEYDLTSDQRLLQLLQEFIHWYMYATKLSKLHIYERVIS